MDVLSQRKGGGWVADRMKDGSRTLPQPFYTTNPLHVPQHKEWTCRACGYDVAERGDRVLGRFA